MFGTEEAVIQSVAARAEGSLSDQANGADVEEGSVVEVAGELGPFVLPDQLEPAVALDVGPIAAFGIGGDGQRCEDAGQDFLDVGAGPDVTRTGDRVELALPATF